MVTAGAGISVAKQAYVLGVTSVTPHAGACPGETVCISGDGAQPGATVHVFIELERALGTTYDLDARYEIDFGTTVAGTTGAWSICAAVPTTVTRTSDYMVVDTPAGDWRIWTESEGVQDSDGSLVTILDCGQTPPPAVTVGTGTALPKTGFPIAAAGALAGLMTSAGVGIRMRKRSR